MTSNLSRQTWVFNEIKSNAISLKLKIFCQVFLHFWSVIQILNIYKKDEPHSWFISQVIECKMCGYVHA